MRPSRATTFVIIFIFKCFFSNDFHWNFAISWYFLHSNRKGTYTTRLQHRKRNQRRWNPVAKQDSDIANSVAESLSNVVEKSLHTSSKESPMKLSMVQLTAEPIAPSSPKAARRAKGAERRASTKADLEASQPKGGMGEPWWFTHTPFLMPARILATYLAYIWQIPARKSPAGGMFSHSFATSSAIYKHI